MPAKQLNVKVRHQPASAIIDLHGEINAFAQSSLSAAYADAEAGKPDVILLNFSDVEYINSTGIALIVSLLARARRPPPSDRVWIKRALRRNLQYHPLGRLYDGLSRRSDSAE